MKIKTTALFLIIGLFSFAQSGKITGKIINSKNGEPLIGATVAIEKLNRALSSDLSGNYTFSGLPAGTYSVTVSFISYAKKSVDEIVVKPGEVVVINISMDEAANKTEEVVVKSTRANKENASAVLIAQKNSASVSDGISAEAIRRTPDRSTSDVLKRVSGASIQEDRFVIIRGLNDRYNAAFINGAALPSSESDRKAFAFDIFPSNILDNLVIYKTATPDMSGEFAGGLINITTKSIPSKRATTFSIALGYNSIITGKESISYKGGKYDFVGIDDGIRKLPEGLPSIQNFPTTTAQRAELAKKFENNWGTYGITTPLNSSFQLTHSLVADRKGKEFFGALLSATYNNSNTFGDGSRYSYDIARGMPVKDVVDRGQFSEKTYNNQTLLGLVANFSLKISDNAKLSWKNIYSVNSTDKTILRQGQNDIASDPDFTVKSSALWFTSNKIFSSQLNGDHYFKKSKLKLNWLISLGSVSRDIPSLRQLAYAAPAPQSPFTASLVSSSISSDNGGSILTSSNEEKITNYKLDFSRNWDWSKDITGIVKFGTLYQNRNRQFNARLLGMARASSNFDYSLLSLNDNDIFKQQNIGTLANGKQGFLLLDGTKPFDSYDATSDILAGYLMLDQKFKKKFRFIYGARIENFTQELNSLKANYSKLNLHTTKLDYLPSVNLVYALNTKKNIRFSYSKTLNRPEFRELAPFAFFDFSTRYTISGIDTLQRASINNYDLRYEIYPGKAQLFSFSLFYKSFLNPIELVSSQVNENEAIYQNAISAKVLGAEAECRYLLGSVFGSNENSILQKMTFTANASVIQSEITMGDFAGISAKDLISKRPLQGQSPYVLNAGFTYSDDKRNLSLTATANRVGQRIFIVGTVNDADIYENARTVLDIQAAKSYFKGNLELKLNIKDALAQQQLFYFDLNSDTKYKENDDKIFSTTNLGRVISLSVSYKF